MKTGLSITGDLAMAHAFDEIAAELEGDGLSEACRETAEKIVTTYREIAPRDTGAMAESAKVRPVAGSKSGWEAYISRDDVVSERSNRGLPIPYDKKRGEPYFYPAEVEFSEKAPLRTAAEKVRRDFEQAVARDLNKIAGV